MKAYQHIKTTQSTNGHPRRLWLVNKFDWDEDNMGRLYSITDTKYIEEDYSGKPRDFTSEDIELPTINVSPTEYYRIKKEYKKYEK